MAETKPVLSFQQGLQKTNGVVIPTYGSSTSTITQGNDNRLSTFNVIHVKKNPGAGEFSSLATALASITGNSFSNQFEVRVGPGQYIEPAITVPHHVTIRGSGIETTQIFPDSSSHHVIAVERAVHLFDITVQNAGAGYAGVYVFDVNRVVVENVDIDNCDIGLYVKSSTIDVLSEAHNVTFEGPTLTNAIKLESTGGHKCELVLNGFSIISGLTHTDSNIVVNGVGTEGHFISGFMRGNAGGDTGVLVTNGGYFSGVGLVIEDCGKGVWADTVGSNPTIEMEAVDFDDCTVNFQIDNSTASGRFIGYTDYSKQTVNFASQFFIANKDARIISVSRKGGDFSSISAAIATISGASDFNQYVVLVGPGVYTEPLIVLPAFVSIIGSGREITRIVPDASNHHGILVSSDHCLIKNLDIETVGVGYAGIAIIDAGDQVVLQNVGLGDVDVGLLVKSVSPTAAFSVVARALVVDAPYNTAVKVESLAGGYTELIGYNFTIEAGVGHTAENIIVKGAGTEFFLLSSFIRGNSALDTGVLITDGGYFSSIGTVVEDCATGVYADMVGTNPTIELESTDFDDCTINFNIANSTATGRYIGYTDYTKQAVNFNSSFFIANKDALNITVSKKGGDFTSVSAAVASITDNSSSKPYQIIVGPGLFVEAQIVMKPYVTISGAGDSVTILQAANPAIPLILGVANAEVKNCKISGASSSGSAGIYHEAGVSDPSGVFFVRSCLFENNYYHFHNKSSVVATMDRMDGCRVVDNDQTNTVILTESTGGFDCSVNITNFLLRDFTALYPVNFIKATGTKAFIRLLASTIRANASGKALWANNGATLKIYGCEIEGFDYGIFSENVGVGSAVDVLGVDVDCVTWDLNIAHPGTTGHFEGSASNSRVFINSSAAYRVNFSDPNPSSQFGNIVLGDIGTGISHAKLFNLTKLTSRSSAMGLISGGVLSKGSLLTLNVTSGSGFCEDTSDDIVEITWSGQSIAVPASSSRYVYFNSSGTLSLSAALPILTDNILLGRVSSNSTQLEYLEQTKMNSYHPSNATALFQRNALGPIFSNGSLVTETGTRQLQIGAGKYYFSSNEFNPSGASPATFDAYYRDGGTGFTEVSAVSTVDNAYYDSGTGTLTALTATYYAKHALYLVGDGADEEYILVYSQVQYSSLVLAEQGNLPLSPGFIDDAVVLIASIIVREGTTNIIEIRDERPVIGFKASGVSAATTHGNLLGLSADDHPQYLLVNGTRAMSGSLNMGTNTITNAGTINAVSITAHASRHLPNGADPLTTATAIEITDATNDVGVQNSMARSDHIHAHGNRGGGTLHAAATTGANGFMSSADKIKLNAIGGARVIKSGLVSAGSFSGNPKKYAVVFGTAFASAGYTIAISGIDSRVWSYESKTSTGFTINANSNTSLTGEVSWTCINTGETVE